MTAVRECGVGGCGLRVVARGYCKRHYDQWHRHGDPLVVLKTMSPRGAPREWLKAHASHEGDACLTWPFSRFPDGRAHMKGAYPTRVMCSLAHGEAPSLQHEAAHRCGKGHEACVNPRHLYWATKAENEADKLRHGTIGRGSALPQSKLTRAQVADIRSLEGRVTQREIAARFGVHLTCINKVLRGRSWKHVE